jgi:Lrp/AsnC family transcriptional regulator, leucine-responsive regulatory protein
VIDATDRRILELLQGNARISNAEIARTIELAPSAVHQRIRKLEERGIIEAYETRVAARTVGRGLVSFVRVQTGEGAVASEISSALRDLAEVQELHRVVGEDCFFLKVRVGDPHELAHLLDERIQRIPGVAATKTTIVLTTAKETNVFPIPRPNDESS